MDTMAYTSIDEVIKRRADKLFRIGHIRPELKAPNENGSANNACLLSSFSQHIIYNILLYVCRLGHGCDKCYNGSFTLADFVLSEDGHIRMSSAVQWVKYSPQGGEADYKQLHQILSVFVDAEQGFPIYFGHLLKKLLDTNERLRRDHDFITFLINHPSLLTYAERGRLFCMLDQMIRKLPINERNTVIYMLNNIKGSSDWIIKHTKLSDFVAVYNFSSASYIIPGTTMTIHFCRNFLNHPHDSVSLIDAEVAVSYLVDNVLADTIYILLHYKPKPNVTVDWDLIGLISNVRADKGILFPLPPLPPDGA